MHQALTEELLVEGLTICTRGVSPASKSASRCNRIFNSLTAMHVPIGFPKAYLDAVLRTSSVRPVGRSWADYCQAPISQLLSPGSRDAHIRSIDGPSSAAITILLFTGD